MFDLQNWNRKFRQATEDFPLSVHYFRPLQIAPEHAAYSRHEEIEFIALHSGTVEIRTPEKLYTLHAGDVALISPYLLHSFRSVTMDVIEVSVKFSPGFLTLSPEHFFQKSFLSPLFSGILTLPVVLTSKHPAHRQVYEALSRLHPDKENTTGYREQLLLTVFAVCTAIAPYCTTQKREKDSTISPVDTCIRYIHLNYRRQLTLEELAEQAGLHPNYLCNRFREVTGKSIFSYLHQVRLEYAKRLLGYTDLPVSEVALRCGFRSPGFFRKKYREFTGMTPQQYHKYTYFPQK